MFEIGEVSCLTCELVVPVGLSGDEYLERHVIELATSDIDNETALLEPGMGPFTPITRNVVELSKPSSSRNLARRHVASPHEPRGNLLKVQGRNFLSQTSMARRKATQRLLNICKSKGFPRGSCLVSSSAQDALRTR